MMIKFKGMMIFYCQNFPYFHFIVFFSHTIQNFFKCGVCVCVCVPYSTFLTNDNDDGHVL